MNHFHFGSIINGIDYSKKTVEDVENNMASDIQNYTLTISGRYKEAETIYAEDIELTYVSDGKIQELMEEQNAFLWPISLFQEKEEEMSATISYDKELLKEKINSLNCYNPKLITPPQDAYYKLEKNKYVIVKEVEGNQLKPDVVYNKAEKAIDEGKTEINLGNNCYETPEYTKKTDKIVNFVNKLNKYLKMKVTYDFGDREEVLTGETIHQWLIIDGENFKVSVNEELVKEYIDVIARTYNTFGSTRDFTTWDGSVVQVRGGDYGWLISRPAEVEALLEIIKKGKSVKREPIYIQTARSRNKDDIGNTYLEINLTAQHIWYFKNGKLLADSNVVTGNESKSYDTPPGSYQITYKQRNATLTGEDYRTPVNYWMPFNRDIGLHDATWRNKFGGKIYKTQGSHGCVNAPFETAQIIYENIEAGVPVICYEKELSDNVMKSFGIEISSTPTPTPEASLE